MTSSYDPAANASAVRRPTLAQRDAGPPTSSATQSPPTDVAAGVLRITIVATSTRARGAETEALQLGQRLRDSGHDCSNLALAPGGGPADSPVTTLGATTLGLDTLRALRREAKKSDVVVAYGSSTLPACAIALAGIRTPFVYRSIGDPRSWVAGSLHRRRTGLLFRRAARVVALWDGAGQDIVDLYGVSPARVTSIPNARDPDQFRPASQEERASARAELGLAADEQVVVTLGALEPEKRVDLAIRTMAMLPDATLLVVGDGSQRSTLEHVANDAAAFTRALSRTRRRSPIGHACQRCVAADQFDRRNARGRAGGRLQRSPRRGNPRRNGR